jgi:hypothetical protein
MYYEGMMPIREGAAENQFYSDFPLFFVDIMGVIKSFLKNHCHHWLPIIAFLSLINLPISL